MSPDGVSCAQCSRSVSVSNLYALPLRLALRWLTEIKIVYAAGWSFLRQLPLRHANGPCSSLVGGDNSIQRRCGFFNKRYKPITHNLLNS